MTKEEIILKLLVSLNRGNCGTIADRPYYAIEQFERLVKKGIIVENTDGRGEFTSPAPNDADVDVSKFFRPPAHL